MHLLSAELGHELVHTLHFLQYLVDALDSTSSNGNELDEVRGFAPREIERMQRVLGHLRRFRLQPPYLADMELLPIVERSTSTLSAGVDVDVAPHLRVRSDAHILDAALRHLLLHRSADPSVGPRIGLHADAVIVDGDAFVQIDICEASALLTETNHAALFNAWDMLPIHGPSFHRAIAFRLLHSIDGTVDYQHTETGNRFCIMLPAARGAL